MKFISKYPKLILLLLSLGILYFFYGSIIVNPNAYMFAGGDGLKNYYTPLWFVKYDSGNHFTGMNYPFGETVTFTDNQPLISWILQFIKSHVTDISGQVIGILNLLMIFSFVPTILFLFLILRHFRLPDWYSIIGALCIGFLSPQLDRWGGHYALSYMFFIPLVWWLTIQLFNKEKFYRWWLAIIFTITALAFIHLYYLLICGFFVFLFSVFYFINYRSESNSRRKFLLGMGAAIIPFILQLTWAHFADTVTDRVETPWGFFFYYASFESVFLPCLNPFYKPVIDFLHVSFNGEGLAYVGIPALIVLIFSIVRAIRYGWKRKWKKILFPVLPPELLITLWTAIIILFYSMCYPFRWNLEWLADYLSFLKQFRSLGRFAWVFYYVFSVYSAHYIFQNYRRLRIKKSKWLSNIFLIVFLGAWSFEAYSSLTFHRANLGNEENSADFLSMQDYPEWLKQAGYSPSDFQAILPLPYFNLGSEKILVSGSSSYPAFKASYSMNLPIATGMMSRTSISQAMKTAQLLSDSLIEKQVLKDYPNKKPLLVISTKDWLNPSEESIVRKSKMIFENDFVKMYLLPLENLAPNYNSVRAFKENMDIKNSNSPVEAESMNSNILQNSFESNPSKFVFDGKGADYLDKGELPVFKSKMNESLVNVPQEFSIWVKVFKESVGVPILFYKQYESSGKLVDEKDLSPGYSLDIVGDWIRMPCLFTLMAKDNIVEFYFTGEMIALDEMLIRPSQVNVISNKKPDASFFFNNIPIPAK